MCFMHLKNKTVVAFCTIQQDAKGGSGIFIHRYNLFTFQCFSPLQF